MRDFPPLIVIPLALLASGCASNEPAPAAGSQDRPPARAAEDARPTGRTTTTGGRGEAADSRDAAATPPAGDSEAVVLQALRRAAQDLIKQVAGRRPPPQGVEVMSLSNRTRQLLSNQRLTEGLAQVLTPAGYRVEQKRPDEMEGADFEREFESAGMTDDVPVREESRLTLYLTGEIEEETTRVGASSISTYTITLRLSDLATRQPIGSVRRMTRIERD